MKNVAIIGCGYIGLMIAEKLAAKKFKIHATVRTSKNLHHVEKIAQNTSILKGSDYDDILRILEHNDIIIVTVAAQSSDDYENAYLKTAKTIRKAAKELNKPKTLIYTSSTSVYGDHQGHWVDEKSELSSSTPQGKILIETEQTYLSLKELGWKSCILRLSEIYGPGRELKEKIENLQDQTLSGDGQNYTNMAHAKDIVGFIEYAIEHHLEGLFNITDDEHPTRKEFYFALAKKYHLTEPKWDPSVKCRTANKRVSNHAMKAVGYDLKVPKRAFH